MANIKQYFKMLGWFAHMDGAWFLRDTRMMLLAVVSDWIANLSSVFGIFLLAWQFDGIGNLTRYEVLFMLGFITLTSGIYEMSYMNSNAGHISRRIGRGQLDHMLIQPVPLWMQLLTEGFIPVSGNSSLISGTVILSVAVYQIGLNVTPVWVLHLVVQLFSSVFLWLGLSYAFGSAAFYAPVAAEEISSDVFIMRWQLGRYPLSGMPKPVQWLLCSFLPGGLIGWFPASALVGKTPLGLPELFPLYITAVVWIVALLLFRKGWLYYVQAGINRYSAFGHRR